MPHQDATMPAPSDPVSDGCRGPRLLGRLLPIVLLACCLATVSDRSGSAAPPSRGRGNAARFFDGLLKKTGFMVERGDQDIMLACTTYAEKPA